MTLLRRWPLALLALLATTLSAAACPFCVDERGPTLVGDFDKADVVLFGHFSNPRLEEQQSDFDIEQVVKPHEIVASKKVLTLPKYVDRPKTKHLLFCDVYKGKIDPYRGIEVQAGSELLKYLSGAMTVKKKSTEEKLRYCFDFLNSSEIEVSLDAYREFQRADYKDYKDMAKSLPPDTIAGWLRDDKTPPYRFGLYASLLGHCGGPKHAEVLLSMIEDPEKRKGSSVDGLIAGYIMLEPRKGWAFVQGLFDEPQKPFLMRYAGLRTIRFLWEYRPDLVSKSEQVKAVVALLRHADMADFAIEDLRKWQRWEMTGPLLKLFHQKGYDAPIIQKAILRFALQSPEPQAAAFVREQKGRDSEWVSDTEELLKLEMASK